MTSDNRSSPEFFRAALRRRTRMYLLLLGPLSLILAIAKSPAFFVVFFFGVTIWIRRAFALRTSLNLGGEVVMVKITTEGWRYNAKAIGTVRFEGKDVPVRLVGMWSNATYSGNALYLSKNAIRNMLITNTGKIYRFSEISRIAR